MRAGERTIRAGEKDGVSSFDLMGFLQEIICLK